MNLIIEKTRNAIVKHGQEFKRIFGVPVNKFLDITGFDIIKFDEWLDTPNGVSSSEFIKKKFGDKAEQLIRNLL